MVTFHHGLFCDTQGETLIIHVQVRHKMVGYVSGKGSMGSHLHGIQRKQYTVIYDHPLAGRELSSVLRLVLPVMATILIRPCQRRTKLNDL